ncbi:unnamed protein product, partial [Rotaria sp. Silwood1]
NYKLDYNQHQEFSLKISGFLMDLTYETLYWDGNFIRNKLLEETVTFFEMDFLLPANALSLRGDSFYYLPICPIGQISPPPFLLAAYGINSKYTAKDVLDRWSSTFDSRMNQNIRILGFSAGCDPKQMKAMRDSMGFEEHPNRFEISLLKVSEQV